MVPKRCAPMGAQRLGFLPYQIRRVFCFWSMGPESWGFGSNLSRNISPIPSTGDQCSQFIVATLVPSTPICLFFNLTKLQCKQTVVTDFCIGFVNKIHIIGKGMIKETWIAKIKESGCWTEKLITFYPFSPISAWSKKLPNFAFKYVDLSWDFGHDVPCMGWGIDVNNEGGLDTRPSSLYWQIEPGVFLAYISPNITKIFHTWPYIYMSSNRYASKLYKKSSEWAKLMTIYSTAQPHWSTRHIC